MRRARIPVLLLALLLIVPAQSATARIRTPDLGLRYDEATSFTVDISGVEAGFGVRVSAQDVPATIVDTAAGTGGTADLLEMRQDLGIVIDVDPSVVTDLPVALSGGYADARLRSVATDWTFDWQPRVSTFGRCAVVTGDPGNDTCAEYHVTHDLSGPVTTDLEVCASMQHTVTYALRIQDEEVTFAGFVPTANGFDGSGQLSTTSGSCGDAIYGVMPGDNITFAEPQQARMTLDGIILATDGSRVLADIDFRGRLRNGLPIMGRGQARLRIEQADGSRTAVASGDIRFVAIVGTGDAAVEVEGRGRIELPEILRTDDVITGAGSATIVASETDGTLTK